MENNNSFFDIYRGLEKPIYILTLGRIINALGGVVMNMLSTILAITYQYDEGEIAKLLTILSVITLPSIFIGSKLADMLNRKKMLVFSYLTVASIYISASFLDIGVRQIALLFTAQIIFILTYPTSSALLSDFAKPEDRARAYSLLYLGINLGYALAPTIGAYLVIRSLDYMLYVNASTLIISAIVIGVFIPSKPTQVELNHEHHNDVFSDTNKKVSLLQVLKENPTILVFTTAYLLLAICHAQFNFGLPMQLINMFGDEQGAKNFAYIATMNCIICVVATPFITTMSYRLGKINVFASAGLTFGLSFVIFAFAPNFTAFAIANFVYTIGEVSMASNGNAILSNLAPESHRGRVMGLSTISSEVGRMLGFSIMGTLVSQFNYTIGWLALMVAPITAGLLVYAIRKKNAM